MGNESAEKMTVHEVIGPFYHTNERKTDHINLLLLRDGENYHYCLITNFSRLVSKQLSSHKAKKYFCDGCLIAFSTETNLLTHRTTGCYQTKIKLPTAKPYIRFEAHEKTLFHNFVCVADFESVLKPIDEILGSKTTAIQLHEACCFGYKILVHISGDKRSLFRLHENLRGERLCRENCSNVAFRMFIHFQTFLSAKITA